MFHNYDFRHGFYDEVFNDDGSIRPVYSELFKTLQDLTASDFERLNKTAKDSFFNQGITFSVYFEDKRPDERIFPFDLLPRVIPFSEWTLIEKGLIQRNKAINLFLYDLYHKQKILKDKIIPKELITSSKHFLKEMVDFDPPGKTYVHISGTDIIRHNDGNYYVLEDNLRTPSGVSYVLSNRLAMKKTLSKLFKSLKTMAVYNYTEHLLEVLESVKPQGVDDPVCVLLTPGMYNSAYYEHSFLAQSMGIQLVEGNDLFEENLFVYMKTIHGPVRVDVIYRRVDDDFIDPDVFRPDSLLGVRGLMAAYRAGNVTLVNAPGTGVADDKAVYAYIPRIIKYYLNEEPILHNVPTYHCENPSEMAYVLENIRNLVVKPVDESGGYGVSICSKLSDEQLTEVIGQIKKEPRKYIAQPIMGLSVHATYIENEKKVEPRHIDLRTFSLTGKDKTFVLKGGLTRVALRKGNLIVNSSQGGGSKDTWVTEE